MNIFVLDEDPQLCAQYHCNKHVVKMILETTQLLNNALSNNANYNPCYKVTHKNHPASIWAMESFDNFNWLLKLGLSLCQEYSFRYEKIHKCEQLLNQFDKTNFQAILPRVGLTTFRLCMPEKYHSNDAVKSYRDYYLNDKRHIAFWKKREIPYWFPQ